ncbi:helix-turn-helix domain-containing protein [Mesorhizobium sp. USDA 4775]|nr:hypothetical protein CK226_10285 [Mesorhizobium sp. WSM4311]TRD06869.1 helix-turn-helix transcriptional regulator [Mesorhizobium sp. WSM4305]
MVARFKLDAAPEAKVYLQEWRETKFPTQQALSDEIGLAAATISRIETGEREWGKGYLEALAHAVGCQVADLFGPPAVDAERALRSALLRFGVDGEDLGRAVSAVKVFVDDRDEQPSPPLPDDRSAPATHRRVKAPSR